MLLILFFIVGLAAGFALGVCICFIPYKYRLRKGRRRHGFSLDFEATLNTCEKEVLDQTYKDRSAN